MNGMCLFFNGIYFKIYIFLSNLSFFTCQSLVNWAVDASQVPSNHVTVPHAGMFFFGLKELRASELPSSSISFLNTPNHRDL
jgi:hypothetical protein